MSAPEPTPIFDAITAESRFADVRAELRRTLYDEIAAAAIDDVMTGFDVLLIWAATAEEGDES